MSSLYYESQADIEAFNSTFRYLNDFLYIHAYFLTNNWSDLAFWTSHHVAPIQIYRKFYLQ